MNDRELLRYMAKHSKATWGSGVLTGIAITILAILVVTKLFSFEILSVTLFFMLWGQSMIQASLVREIIRLEEKIEELERRIP